VSMRIAEMRGPGELAAGFNSAMYLDGRFELTIFPPEIGCDATEPRPLRPFGP